MMFWLSAAAMTSLAVFFIIRAFLKGRPDALANERNVAFFQSQEAEIVRQVAAGLMSEEEAAALRAEAARRLLALTREASGAGAPDERRSPVLAIVLALAIPATAYLIYARLGSPQNPDLPFDTRADLNRSAVDLARLIGKLDAHLAQTPDDARGWELAFPVYMRLGRFDDAAEAARRIIALRGETAERHASLAEALISAGQGQISADANTAIQRALALDAGLARARFFAGMAAEQSGDAAGALDIWRKLVADLADGPEKSLVQAQIERLAASPRGPAAEALKSLPQEEQQAAIRGMVDSLEARLKDNGGTPDEWVRLVRALRVLGERNRAIAAIDAARAGLKGDAAANATLDQLARELAEAR